MSGNSARDSAGGIGSIGNLTLTNSTVSGNSAGGRGGGLDIGGTLTLTNSTVSGNSATGAGGGVSNRSSSSLTLVQTVVSGNTASAQGPEVYNYPGGAYAAGTVIADNLNLFGHDGLAGIVGFVQGPNDNVPSGPLAATLNPTLGDNGGLTRTHALVAGSPAVDGVPAASCATTIDQRGIARPQDGDGNTVADCDIGAFELQPPPPAPPPPPPPNAAPSSQNLQLGCTGSVCRIPIKCDAVAATSCNIAVKVFVSKSALRHSDEPVARAQKRLLFAAGATNIPAGQTANVKLKLRKGGEAARAHQHAKENPGRHGDPKLDRDG